MSGKTEKRCYICGKLGHISSDSVCEKVIVDQQANRSASCQGRCRPNSPGKQVQFQYNGGRRNDRSTSPARQVMQCIYIG